jgi:integrase
MYRCAQARRRKPGKVQAPSTPLLYVPSHPAREFDTDLERARIHKWSPEGKIDFHALRVTYCTLVAECGANFKDTMTLMRHTTPDPTANVYTRSRNDKLHDLAERVGDTLKSTADCAPTCCRPSLVQRGIPTTIAMTTK